MARPVFVDFERRRAPTQTVGIGSDTWRHSGHYSGDADEAGISEVWVSQIERGTASPSFDTIARLATALSIEPAELFGGVPPAKGRAGNAFAALVRKLSGRSEADLKRFTKMVEFLDRP